MRYKWIHKPVQWKEKLTQETNKIIDPDALIDPDTWPRKNHTT